MTTRLVSKQAAAIDARFADRLRAVRRAKGLTRPTLANWSGMGFEQIRDIEVGRAKTGRRPVTIGEAMALCRALQVSPAAMVNTEPLDLGDVVIP